MNTIKCIKCNINKNVSEFYKSFINKHYYCCKQCALILEKNRDTTDYHKKYYEKNKDYFSDKQKEYAVNNVEKIQENQKQYRIKNKVKIRKQKRQYYLNNKNKINNYQSEYKKQKRNNDPLFKLKENVSGQIFKFLKSKGRSKSKQSSINFISWTYEELKTHLESLFEPWMNWENQGHYKKSSWIDDDQSTWKWQLDHIIPHSRFDYETMDCEEFRQCWALSNLRPYSAKQNVLDGNRRS